MSKKYTITFKALFDGKTKFYEVNGKAAKTLHALTIASSRGITACEMSGTWAYRLAAYVHDLRQGYGMDIQTLREEHEDGWHGRYVLITPVEITDIESK